MKRPKLMTCSCCGSGCMCRQWFNRDTGYGLCASCANWIEGRGATAEEMKSNYGVRGVHYDIPEKTDNPEQEGMARRAAKMGSDFLDHDHSMDH